MLVLTALALCEEIVHEKQLWRTLTAALSHFSFLHLVFNMATMWSMGPMEAVATEGGGAFE